MAVELDIPGSAEELYLARGEPVEPWRPLATGDIFAGPQIPGCSGHELVIVIAHPCSLRRGIDLVDRIQALPVAPHQTIALEHWRGHFRVMPLPDLRGDGTAPYAARLTEFGMVSSTELDLHRRICCLSDLGIVLLQQRFFHNQSRVKVRLDTLAAASAPVLAEIELWEQWNEVIVEPRVTPGDRPTELLAAEAVAFDELMRSAHTSGTDLRGALASQVHRTDVRRRVLAAARERAA